MDRTQKRDRERFSNGSTHEYVIGIHEGSLSLNFFFKMGVYIKIYIYLYINDFCSTTKRSGKRIFMEILWMRCLTVIRGVTLFAESHRSRH